MPWPSSGPRLRVNDLTTAEKTLNGLSEAAKQTAGYHAAFGRLAEMKKNPVQAEIHWAKASEIAPENTSYQFQLALIRLATNDQAKRESALKVLERLRADPKQRAVATRTLILDGVARKEDAHRMRSLAKELQNYPEAPFSDRLLYLEILRQLRDPEFAEYLKKLEDEAASRPADLAALISWMAGNETAAAAVEFAKDSSAGISGQMACFACARGSLRELERLGGTGTPHENHRVAAVRISPPGLSLPSAPGPR